MEKIYTLWKILQNFENRNQHIIETKQKRKPEILILEGFSRFHKRQKRIIKKLYLLLQKVDDGKIEDKNLLKWKYEIEEYFPDLKS